jgi:phosphonate transport system permease protein
METTKSTAPSRHGLLPWWQRLSALHLCALAFILIFVGALWKMPYSGRETDWASNVGRFMARLFPPDFSTWPEFLSALAETCQIAVIATAAAFLVAIPMAALASRNITPCWVTVPVRLLLNGIRTVPGLLWAIIAVAIVGASPWAGVLALVVYSIGYLGKFYSDAIESVDFSIARSLKAMGAHPIQAIQYGLWPLLKPLIWSQALWMLEYNIRSATIIGYVGAGGVGTLLHAYQEYFQWNKVSAILIFVLAVVIFLDGLSEWLRGKLNITAKK